MMRLAFRGERIDDLLEFLSESYGTKANVIKEIDDKKIGFFVSEKYYLRSNAQVSCSILYCQKDKENCEVDVAVSSGWAGLLELDWGAKDHMKKTKSKDIIEQAKQLKLEVIEQTDEYEEEPPLKIEDYRDRYPTFIHP